MITAVPARPRMAPASFSSVAGSCRVMPQVIRNAKIGVVEASTTVDGAGTYCCAQVISRNGNVELMVCCCANSFQALASVGIRSPRRRRIDEQESGGDQRARRDEGDRRDRAEADLGQRIGRTPAARQREQQRIVAPAATGLWRVSRQRRAASARLPLHPLDGAGEGEQRALAGFQHAAQEDQRAAGAGDFAVAFDQFALAGGVEEFAGERHRHARALPAPGRRSQTGNNRRTT